MPDAGPPPVNRSAVVPSNEGLNLPARNYLTIVETLKANKGAEAKAIQAMFGGDRKLMDQFLAMAFSLLQSNPKILADCDPMSLVQVIKDGASLGLVPMTEDAAVIPYGRTAKLMPMWRGYVKRIRNSREVTELDVQVVYMNDQFELQLGTEPRLVHVPKLYGEKDDSGALNEERGDYRGFYAWALMPSGKYIIEYMSADDINHVRDTWGNKRSRSGEPLPWETSYAEMGRKTVIRRLAKRLPAAAVDRLLALDKGNDDARDEMAKLSASVDDGLKEVRQLALRAVGQIPAGETAPTEDNEEASGDGSQPPGQDGGEPGQGGSGVVAEPKPDAGGPGAAAEPERPPDEPELVGAAVGKPSNATDPNVAAAMAVAEQQRQLELQRGRRPGK